MTTQRINLTQLRAKAEEANHPDSEYADVLGMFDELGPPTVLALLNAVEAARAVMARPSFHWEDKETTNLREALDRFDYQNQP